MSAAPPTPEELHRIDRDELKPHFHELAKCESTPDLLGSETYRQVGKQAELVLSKPTRTAPFDVVKCFRTDTITCAAPRPVRILAPKRGI